MNQKRRAAARNCSALLSTNFLPQIESNEGDDGDSTEDEQVVQARKEKKDTIMRVAMSRDFALTVREEADVLDVIKGFSSEFLMSETHLPSNLSSHLMSLYPVIEYKV